METGNLIPTETGDWKPEIGNQIPTETGNRKAKNQARLVRDSAGNRKPESRAGRNQTILKFD